MSGKSSKNREFRNRICDCFLAAVSLAAPKGGEHAMKIDTGLSGDLPVASEAHDQPTADLLTQRMLVHEKNA
jgi:hypothetical protein